LSDNEKGEPYRFRYNVLDMLTEELRLDGKVCRLRYDRTGFLIRETLLGTEGGELSTGLECDKTGRLVLKTQADQRTEYDHRAGELHIG